MSPRPDQPDDTNPDPNEGTSPATPAGRAAERIIEKFGGIRPMAHKLEVPVTTVQGWKKRGAIPTARHADLLAAAQRHGIEMDPAELTAAAPSDEAGLDVPAETRPAETRPGGTAGEAGAARVFEADGGEASGPAPGAATPGMGTVPASGAAEPPREGRAEASASARPAAERPVPADPPARRSGGRGLAAFATLLSLLALGTAITSPWWAPDLLGPTLGPPPQSAAMEARVAQLDARVGELSSRPAPDTSDVERRVAALEQAMSDLRQQAAQPGGQEIGGQAAGAPGEGNQELAQRVAQLEQQLQQQQGPQDTEMADLRQRLDQMAQRIGELSDRAQQTQDLSEAQRRNAEAIAMLETEANRLAAEVSAASERAAGAEAAVSRRNTADAETQALVLAAGQLRSALQGSGDFADELQAVRQLGAADPQVRDALASISPLSDTGVPTVSQLASRFEGLASEIVRAGQQEGEQPWYEKAANQVSSLVTVRRVAGEVEGNSAAAIVSRAEARLEENDLEGAVAQVGMLAGPAAETAAPWLRDAQARLAADRAVAALTRQAISRLAGAGPQAEPQGGPQGGTVTQ